MEKSIPYYKPIFLKFKILTFDKIYNFEITIQNIVLSVLDYDGV